SAAAAARAAASAQDVLYRVEALFMKFQDAVAGTGNTNSKNSKMTVAGVCQLQSFLQNLSLNAIRVLVGCEMSFDVDSLPGSLKSGTFDRDTDLVACLAEAGDKTGVVTGTYLTGAQVQIANGEAHGLKVETIADGSNDTTLKFKMTVTKPIPTESSIQFIVT